MDLPLNHIVKAVLRSRRTVLISPTPLTSPFTSRGRRELGFAPVACYPVDTRVTPSPVENGAFAVRRGNVLPRRVSFGRAGAPAKQRPRAPVRGKAARRYRPLALGAFAARGRAFFECVIVWSRARSDWGGGKIEPRR